MIVVSCSVHVILLLITNFNNSSIVQNYSTINRKCLWFPVVFNLTGNDCGFLQCACYSIINIQFYNNYSIVQNYSNMNRK